MGGRRALGESHAGRVYVDTHTHFQQGLNKTLLFQKWPPDLYPSTFKWLVMSAEIEVLTATLDSFSLILF